MKWYQHFLHCILCEKGGCWQVPLDNICSLAPGNPQQSQGDYLGLHQQNSCCKSKKPSVSKLGLERRVGYGKGPCCIFCTPLSGIDLPLPALPHPCYPLPSVMPSPCWPAETFFGRHKPGVGMPAQALYAGIMSHCAAATHFTTCLQQHTCLFHWRTSQRSSIAIQSIQSMAILDQCLFLFK